MKVLIVGGGGREHALAWKLARSPRVREILAAPGNAGISPLARCVEVSTPEALLALAEAEGVDLTVVGPEAPLVAGVVDLFEAAGLRIVGPGREAARLEGSKRFAKAFMTRHGVPTAAYEAFTELEVALTYLEHASLPIVVKDSNLAAGKGVTVARARQEAQEAVRGVLTRGGELVIEDFLEGRELSLILLLDGATAKPMLLAQDHKRLLEGDTGPMTGGMGTVAPVPFNEAQWAEVMDEVVAPTLRGLEAEGLFYKGVLFIGLMVTAAGVRVLEYNVRLGDPETQVVLPLLENDLLDVFEALLDGRLHEMTLRWSQESAACVVMAAPGYPGAYEKGVPLDIPESDNVTAFHAGTSWQDGRLVSSGGRVLGVTAVGAGLRAALDKAYGGVAKIGFPGAQYRRDLGRGLTK